MFEVLSVELPCLYVLHYLTELWYVFGILPETMSLFLTKKEFRWFLKGEAVVCIFCPAMNSFSDIFGA